MHVSRWKIGIGDISISFHTQQQESAFYIFISICDVSYYQDNALWIVGN